MLTLPREMLDAIAAHALREHPLEACGVVAGKDGTATRVIPMVNAEQSTQLHRFDSREQLAVWRAMDDADEVPLVIYHSHTASSARPSARDIALASLPEAQYLIVSTHSAPVEVGAFRITDGTVTDVALRVT